jgi:hypothetical protein
MPKNPAFELFEVVCRELASKQNMVLPEDDIPSELVEDLKERFSETADHQAFVRAIDEISQHFEDKSSKLPFQFNTQTGQFSSLDNEYVNFISLASNMRGVGGVDSKNFEIQTLHRLAKRLTGVIYRVGFPRQQNKKKAEFVKYLMKLGFDKNCLEARDKDGGFDLLWLPPLGAIPLRPVVSLQCKNSSFDEGDAATSAARARRTLTRHSHGRGHHHLVFVIFNDYIDRTFIGRGSGWIFLPLGLSDLGEPSQAVKTYEL